MIKKVKKLWGKEEWLVNDDLYCCKYLYLKKGFQCSLHYHRLKTETFYVLSGIVLLELNQKNEFYTLHKGGHIKVYPYNLHRFQAITPKAKILEVSTHHEDSDSYRIEIAKEITT